MAGGAHEYGSYLKQEDLEVYNSKIFVENLKILNSVKPENHKELIFTTNYRIKNRAGNILSLMEKYMYIRSSEDGMPLISLGFAYDISDLNMGSKMVHTVKRVCTKNGLINSDTLITDYHFASLNDKLISKRELEVLKWTCEGLSSKEVADKLFISINTVNNHKKSIRQKTNTHNSNELFAYAVQNPRQYPA